MNWFAITCRGCGDRQEFGTPEFPVRVEYTCPSCGKDVGSRLEKKTDEQPSGTEQKL